MASRRFSRLEIETFHKNIWKIYLFEFFKALQFISAVLIPFFTLWGGITFFQVMILQAIFTFSIFLLEIPTGTIADRFGRKTSLVFGAFISAIAALIYASYADFRIFILAELMFALGASLISGADQSLIYDSLKAGRAEEKSKKIFGRTRSIHLIALMIGAPIGSLIAEAFGVRAPMLFLAIPLALSGFIALTLKEPELHKKTKKENYIETLKTGVAYFKNHKILKIMTLDFAVIGALSFFLIWVYQVILENLEVSIAYFGFMHAVLVAVQILVLNSFSFLEKISGGKRKYLLISGLIPGLGFLVLAFSNNLTIVLISMLAIGAFGLTRKTIFSNYMNKLIDSKHRATILSTAFMMYSAVQTIGNLIFGYLVDVNLKATLLAIGLLIIAFAIFSKVEEEYLLD